MLQLSKVQNPHTLRALASPTTRRQDVKQIAATSSAFAAIRDDGSIVAWGDQGDGGDCSAVADQLRDAQLLQATDQAFAALLQDPWGPK